MVYGGVREKAAQGRGSQARVEKIRTIRREKIPKNTRDDVLFVIVVMWTYAARVCVVRVFFLAHTRTISNNKVRQCCTQYTHVCMVGTRIRAKGNYAVRPPTHIALLYAPHEWCSDNSDFPNGTVWNICTE